MRHIYDTGGVGIDGIIAKGPQLRKSFQSRTFAAGKASYGSLRDRPVRAAIFGISAYRECATTFDQGLRNPYRS
jgi:hypothetical protein